ncbi:MAG: hypothetical protein ABSE06_19155, partial [Anaerolineaceae bacterium]
MAILLLHGMNQLVCGTTSTLFLSFNKFTTSSRCLSDTGSLFVAIREISNGQQPRTQSLGLARSCGGLMKTKTRLTRMP